MIVGRGGGCTARVFVLFITRSKVMLSDRAMHSRDCIGRKEMGVTDAGENLAKGMRARLKRRTRGRREARAACLNYPCGRESF